MNHEAAGQEPRVEQARPVVAPEAPKPRSARRPLVILGGLLAAVALAFGGYSVATANQRGTDDAQVEADIVPIGARLGSTVKAVPARDNQQVKAGELLVELDDSDVNARLTAAEAELETARAQELAANAQVTLAKANARGGLSSAKATLSGTAGQVTSAQAQIAAAEAGLRRAEAQATKTGLALKRVKDLLAKNAVAKQDLDDAQAADDAAQAGVDLAKAEVAEAKQSKRVAQSHVAEARGKLDQSLPIDSQIAVAEANQALARARVRSAEASVKLAKLQLSHARITAPGDGIVSRISVHMGQLVQPGQPVAEFVPAETYVVANFKETEIAKIRPGERATVKLDAFPDRKFEGKVSSLSAATGARFALFPADNASGNYVKVVQRVPVRISWTKPPDVPMYAGLSADVTVFVEP